MASYVHVAENPRRLALRSENSVLFISCQHSDKAAKVVRCTARLEPTATAGVGSWPLLTSRPIYGCLGLISVADDVFIALTTDVQDIGVTGEGETINRITGVSFYSLLTDKYDTPEIYVQRQATTTTAIALSGDFQSEEYYQQQTITLNPCADLQKLLSNGQFYFSNTFDLTRSLQARSAASVTSLDSYDPHFLWNEYMIKGLLNFRSKLSESEQTQLDESGILTCAIQGYVGIINVTLCYDIVRLALISRLSCLRAGTRFNTRGVDDNGNVANFVETETLVYIRSNVLSFVQVRGSVPVFWEQQGLQVMNHKIQISRGAGATQPAVDRHFNDLINRYQQVHVVNLLSQKDGGGELTLSEAFKTHIAQAEPELRDRIAMTTFDFHAAVKGGNIENLSLLVNKLRGSIEGYGSSVMDGTTRAVVLSQRGVFRTNCLDCLDRTNVVQSLLARNILESYLSNISQRWRIEFADVLAAFSTIWADNGDALSRLYAGTGALKSGITRTGKMTLAGFLDDATKSATRFYLNNFTDKAKQELIDTLLGKLVSQRDIVIHDPVHDAMNLELKKRSSEFHSKRKIIAHVGTYNVNGKLPTAESLQPWLDPQIMPDIYVLGFQEMVELSPQQIMSTDPSKRVVWENEVSKVINRNSSCNYVMLRSGQLVGACIIIFVRSEHVGHIRNLECVIKKTGLRGMSGNKGAISVRFLFHDTTLCFVTAHLAAGMVNYEERNNDYHTITQGLVFAKGRTLSDHENVIWLGDLNYRIDMPIEEVKAYIEKRRYDAITPYDQLNVQRLRAGAVFKDFTEAEIDFDPTYKYDNGTTLYDTSDKMRVPAWTDRILYRGPAIRQKTYQRAELYLSDHRPVKGLFEIDLLVVNREAKEKIQRQIYAAKKEELHLASRVSKVKVDTLIDFDVQGSDKARSTGVISVSELPPPSSNEGKNWWESDESIHASVANGSPATVGNPFETTTSYSRAVLPQNPFQPTAAAVVQVQQQQQMQKLNQPGQSSWQPLMPTKSSPVPGIRPPGPVSISRNYRPAQSESQVAVPNASASQASDGQSQSAESVSSLINSFNGGSRKPVQKIANVGRKTDAADPESVLDDPSAPFNRFIPEARHALH